MFVDWNIVRRIMICGAVVAKDFAGLCGCLNGVAVVYDSKTIYIARECRKTGLLELPCYHGGDTFV